MTSDVRYKIETSLPVIWLETIDFEKSGFVRTQRTTHNWSWSLVDPVDWFGTGLGSSSSNELISARLSCRDSLRSAPWFSVSARSIDRDSFWFRSGFRVRLSRLNSGSVIRIRIRIRNSFEPKVRELVHSSWSFGVHHFYRLNFSTIKLVPCFLVSVLN